VETLTAVWQVLARANASYVALAVAIYALSVPVSALRWRTVLRGLDERLPLGRLILVNLASMFVNNVTPSARASGEVCRVAALSRMRLNFLTSAASIAYERLSEVPAILIVVFVATLSFSADMALHRLAIAGGAVLALAAVAFGARFLAAFANRWTARLRAIAIAPSALAAAGALSLVVWTLDVVRLRVAAATMHVTIGWPQAAALSAVTVAAGWIPTIGGLGVIEGGLVAALIAFGVAPIDAAAVTAVERIISYGLATAAGAAALSLIGGRALLQAARQP